MALKTTLEDTKDRLDALLTYANGVTGESDTSIGDAIETLADGYGQGGSSLPIELVGTWTGYLGEYTDTTTWEATDTGINIHNSPYIYFMITVSCDGSYSDTSITNYWSGFEIIVGGKYNSNKNFCGISVIGYKGVIRPQTNADLTSNITNISASYGVSFLNNQSTFKIQRKCNASVLPKIMGGNYTVKVYGISGI